MGFVLPDSRNEFAEHYSNRRPTGDLVIDWNHPVSKGLVCSVIPQGNRMVDIAGGRWDEGALGGFQDNAGAVTGVQGVDASEDRRCALSTGQVTPPSVFTVVQKWRKTDPGVSWRYYYYCNAYTRFSLFSDLAGTAWRIGSSTINVNPGAMSGDWIVFVHRYDGSTTYLDFSTGASKSLAATLSAPALDNLAIGGNPDSDDRSSGGVTELFEVYDRVVSDIDTQRLLSNPYLNKIPA